jgi:hypothetical protein
MRDKGVNWSIWKTAEGRRVGELGKQLREIQDRIESGGSDWVLCGCELRRIESGLTEMQDKRTEQNYKAWIQNERGKLRLLQAAVRGLEVASLPAAPAPPATKPTPPPPATKPAAPAPEVKPLRGLDRVAAAFAKQKVIGGQR